jgi:hypothetical protein
VNSAEAAVPGTASARSSVSKVVYDSETKCAAFLNSLVLTETGTNTSLDMLTTVFSALGTAFTPIATVHSLTAAATISGGWKTAIDSDIFAKATIANYAQAIQATYSAKISDYISNLGSTADPSIDPASEITKIQSIHALCGLGPAQSTISASLTPGPSQPANQAINSVSYTISGTVSAPDQITLIATSSVVTDIPNVTINVVANETPADIAKALVSAVTQNITSIHSSITAGLGSDPNNIQVILKYPASNAITWSYSGGTKNAQLKILPSNTVAAIPLAARVLSLHVAAPPPPAALTRPAVLGAPVR